MYSIDYIHYLSTTSRTINLKCPSTSTIINQVPGIKKENRQGKKLTKIIMKNGTKTNIMRSGSRPSPEETRLLLAGTVSPMICRADRQQKDDEEGQTEDKPR